MASNPKLIYCANGNRRFAEIAANAGFAIGAQLPGTVYHKLAFADQDWKKPNRGAYMAALAAHRPAFATVLDWEREEQLSEVLDWAEEAAQYATEAVLIIPKVVGGVERLPRRIGGKRVILAYSVPTGYGGTPCSLREFWGWGVHLLGGSPHKQMQICRYLSMLPRCQIEVVSVDGNMANKMAVRHNQVWEQKANRAGRWVRLQELNGGEPWVNDAPYEAFRRSCCGIQSAWSSVSCS